MFILYKIYNKNNSYFSTIVYPFLYGKTDESIIKLTRRRLTREWNEQFNGFFSNNEIIFDFKYISKILWNVKIIL